MKRFLIILTISLFCVSVAKAQSASADTLSAKVDSLTTQLTTLQSSVIALRSTIATLEGKVNEVTAQNLALKHAISLQPTIAEDKSELNISHKLISAKGNPNTGEVTFVISVKYLGTGDFKVMGFETPVMVDEQGKRNEDINIISTIGGRVLSQGIELYQDTPVEMLLKFNTNNQPQYAKTLTVRPNINWHKDGFTFRNIPIKWE